MSPEVPVKKESLPTDIRALLITEWRTRGDQDWQERFEKAFDKFGDLFIVDLDHATEIVDVENKKFEVVFVACQGEEPKETLYPSLRRNYPNALIIAIPSMIPESDEVREYLTKQSKTVPYADDLWRLSYDSKVLSNYLTETSLIILNLRKVKKI